MDCYVEKYVALITQPLALNIICLREESNTYFKNEVFSTICTKKTACIEGEIMGDSANDKTKSRKQRKKV